MKMGTPSQPPVEQLKEAIAADDELLEAKAKEQAAEAEKLLALQARVSASNDYELNGAVVEAEECVPGQELPQSPGGVAPRW